MEARSVSVMIRCSEGRYILLKEKMCFKYSLMFDNWATILMHPGDSQEPQKSEHLLSGCEVPVGTNLGWASCTKPEYAS